MADIDQNPSLAAADTSPDMSAQQNGTEIPVSVSGDESGAPTSFSDTVWIFGEVSQAGQILPIDTLGTHQHGDGSDLSLSAAMAVEAPANLDHALDQLTTATDLFDVPALDFHSS